MAVDLVAKTKPTLAGRVINGHDPGANQAHWFLHDDNASDLAKARLDSIADTTLALFEVMVKRRNWADLEDDTGDGALTSGAFDLEPIRRDLAHAAERGIPYMPLIDNRTFDSSDTMPSDLTANWQIANGTTRTACIFHATPRTRYLALLLAILDEFKDHPYFAGIYAAGETSGQNTCTGAVYSLAAETTGWNTIFKTLAEHSDHLYVVAGWNFMTGVGGGATEQQIVDAWDDVWVNVPTANVVPVTPDILLPGSPDHFEALDGRVYKLFNADYYGAGNGFTSSLLNFRRGSSMQHDSYRFSDVPTDPFFNEKGDPAAEGGANDLDSDGVLDMQEQMLWATRSDRLNLDLIIWTHHDFEAGAVTVDFSFDRKDHVNGYGTLVGDAVGAIQQGWNGAHNPLYRGGPPGGGDPESVSAVVALIDAFGFPDGFGPSDDPEGVFFGRTDLTTGDEWTVTDVSVAGVTVTPLAGGSYTVEADPGVAPGTYSFDWEITAGPSAPDSGSKNFDVV